MLVVRTLKVLSSLFLFTTCNVQEPCVELYSLSGKQQGTAEGEKYDTCSHRQRNPRHKEATASWPARTKARLEPQNGAAASLTVT